MSMASHCGLDALSMPVDAQYWPFRWKSNPKAAGVVPPAVDAVATGPATGAAVGSV